MNLSEFYSRYSDEQSCISFLKNHLEKKVSCCSKCSAKKLVWKESFAGWRCAKCSTRISLKSISFMRDSNLSFVEWMELIFLVLHGKKSRSISEILRLSRQTRHDTVSYAVKKIRQELIDTKLKADAEFYDLIEFDHDSDEIGLNSIDTPGIPTTIKIFIKPSKLKRQDQIYLEISGKYHLDILSTKISRHLSPQYRHKKLCTIKIKNEESNSLPSTINHLWKKKVKENFIKSVKGIHHNLSLLFMQGVLNEYCFKYNLRNSSLDPLSAFMQLFETNVRQNCGESKTT